ncbi:hypothetical protein FB451DRAFT_1227997 [Mycena latifolia]|nr:hypothetical protein FB451DRAFT_1227997 [Mycena latifolia]
MASRADGVLPVAYDFSKLEATIVAEKPAPRPNSLIANNVARHKNPDGQVMVDEFDDLDYSLSEGDWALAGCRAISDVLPAVQFHTALTNPNNFSTATEVQCLRIDEGEQAWLPLSDDTLPMFLSRVDTREAPTLYAFFVPLHPKPDCSFGNTVGMTRGCVEQLFSTFDVDPAFAMNMLGRPDYWAPVTHMLFDEQDALEACDHWCQHPRWNLHYQGAPLSVYMRFDRRRNTILYIISYKEDDTIVNALRSMLALGARSVGRSEEKRRRMYLEDPFHLHTMVSFLSFEAMKNHIVRFRRFMWQNINAVEDHQTGSVDSNREELRKRTTALQTTTSNADSLIAGAEVAIITASAIRKAHRRLHDALASPKARCTPVGETIQYVLDSFEKQKMWLLNYQTRNQSSMGLVFNLVTQDDAANNINLAVAMRADSASMSAIALLTMLFLPATFTATILSSGIFDQGAAPMSSDIGVTNFWWFWLVLTVPLTVATLISWRMYHRKVMGGLITK